MSADTRIGKFLTARRFAPVAGQSTSRWQILGNDGTILGRVTWYAPWRQYTFDPAECTTFNTGCLRDIVAFLDKANREHKARGGAA